MANTGLILGLAGIAGTLAGALSANGVSLLIERRKEQREERGARGEVRKAARLVGTELQEAMGAVATVLSSGRLWAPEHAPTRAAWLEYSALLATNLNSEEYRPVSRAYVQLKRDLALAFTADDEQLPKPYLEGMELTQRAIQEACVALERLAALD